jgi:hypothetical protein
MLPLKTARLLTRLRRVEELAPTDQRAVLKLVDAMLETRHRSTAPSPARNARRADGYLVRSGASVR